MLDSLKAALADKVSTAPTDLETHGKDEAYPIRSLPQAVVYAQSLEDVVRTLDWARESGLAVIPFGTGTSLEGHVLPQGPAISLDLSRMNRVLEVRPEDFLAIVEPGVTREQLNAALKGTGLFFPVDPGANASLGGMASTNASGTTTVRYGGMHHNVLALQVVLADGEVLELGRAVRKTSAGYDLKDLFIGSEGTLGVITRLTLRLHPLPSHVHTLRVFFHSLEAAADAAYALMGSGLPLARLELLDELSLSAINRYLQRSYPEKPALFVEFHSSTREALEAESQMALELMREAGAVAVDAARTPEERNAQWEARHQLYWALVAQYPGHKFMITDTAVPLSRMPELVRHSQRLLREMGLGGSIVGHVGDGNFHTLVATGEQDYPKAEAFSARLVEKALELGGTCTGEHGVGLRKKKYLAHEHGAALEWMRQLKRLFDPQNILNPGKVV
ncbi:FAD-binding oxidoreductase [Calidithermus roseus]|uniref:D-lactate dehydrogenase (cytochrome) n=1 Tax=Calidithermus roseus TaxID=1644118 RepID=A0A399EXC5_9DEIN|nr:FAD-binding oxidoreductase [Calidithermus roseus]RIH88245.1 putative FAD-linked oxidoreductase [Calidithermus roseus]